VPAGPFGGFVAPTFPRFLQYLPFNKGHKSFTILKDLFLFGTINEALFIFGHTLDAEDSAQSERILLVAFIVGTELRISLGARSIPSLYLLRNSAAGHPKATICLILF
jgi:NAD/NADP transhydrogenase beta subunit